MPNLSETLPARKKRALSLIQPSGIPTLGNYLGAMRNWVALQDEFECIFGVADLHAVTVRQEPAKLRQRTYEVYALLLPRPGKMPGVCPVPGARPRGAFLAARLLYPVRGAVPDDPVQGQIPEARR